MVYTRLYLVYTGMYLYEVSIRESKSAHDLFTLDSRWRWRVMGQVCLHIQTFENHSKVQQNWVSMKSTIPQYTQHNQYITSMKCSYWDIPRCTEYIAVWAFHTELSRWSGFQMAHFILKQQLWKFWRVLCGTGVQQQTSHVWYLVSRRSGIRLARTVLGFKSQDIAPHR